MSGPDFSSHQAWSAPSGARTTPGTSAQFANRLALSRIVVAHASSRPPSAPSGRGARLAPPVRSRWRGIRPHPPRASARAPPPRPAAGSLPSLRAAGSRRRACPSPALPVRAVRAPGSARRQGAPDRRLEERSGRGASANPTCLSSDGMRLLDAAREISCDLPSPSGRLTRASLRSSNRGRRR